MRSFAGNIHFYALLFSLCCNIAYAKNLFIAESKIAKDVLQTCTFFRFAYPSNYYRLVDMDVHNIPIHYRHDAIGTLEKACAITWIKPNGKLRFIQITYKGLNKPEMCGTLESTLAHEFLHVTGFGLDGDIEGAEDTIMNIVNKCEKEKEYNK